MLDTIVAISTSLGAGAINVIRISGKNSINIVNKIFNGKNLEEVDTHTIHYGYIMYENEKIDEVLVSVFKTPKTYTRENIVEINCHGGVAPTNKILEILLLNGCRLAEPGEFTKRAFLNGRIDLIEAEGVMNLLESKTEEARKLAINQINGNASNMIKKLRKEIIEIIANIEVNIDYPEYDDILEMSLSHLRPFLNNLETKINKIIAESETGLIIKEGINTLIIGRPNVGKSSLLNLLIGEEKAIVTNIAGTTRDIVEGKINMDGIILNIIDTAGIRETEDIVEQKGVEKSLNLIERADLILYVLSNNEEITEEDKEILDRIKNKNHIILINKVDLESKLKIDNNENIVKISTLKETGIEDLKTKIKNLFQLEKIKNNDMTYLTNAKAIATLKEIKIIINNINIGLNLEIPIDIIEIDIKKIWTLLGEIIGETYSDELIDQLFSQFCLGK